MASLSVDNFTCSPTTLLAIYVRMSFSSNFLKFMILTSSSSNYWNVCKGPQTWCYVPYHIFEEVDISFSTYTTKQVEGLFRRMSRTFRNSKWNIHTIIVGDYIFLKYLMFHIIVNIQRFIHFYSSRSKFLKDYLNRIC